eukprot:GDKI01033597.1.p1 GENE.GDKI01033597.1~~GDKI01033597.1.p1  ORF type:complete len:120 (+),score=27.90 GDKI01033597.1:43-360(+)
MHAASTQLTAKQCAPTQAHACTCTCTCNLAHALAHAHSHMHMRIYIHAHTRSQRHIHTPAQTHKQQLARNTYVGKWPLGRFHENSNTDTYTARVRTHGLSDCTRI